MRQTVHVLSERHAKHRKRVSMKQDHEHHYRLTEEQWQATRSEGVPVTNLPPHNAQNKPPGGPGPVRASEATEVEWIPLITLHNRRYEYPQPPLPAFRFASQKGHPQRTKSSCEPVSPSVLAGHDRVANGSLR